MHESTGLDDFFGALADVKRIALAAAGGLLIIPMLASLGGYQPPWPPGVIGITSLIELVILIIAFQFFSRARRTQTSRAILVSATLLLFFSLTYLTLHSIFVYSIPNNSTKVILGCGLSEKAEMVLSSMKQPPRNVCPGEFNSLLAAAQYETEVVWNKLSVDLIRVGLAISWLGAFGSLAALIGIFVSFQRRQKATPEKRTSPS